MGILSDIFSDPQKLQRASSFLLNFGQSALQAGQQGRSTLAGIGAGFGGGGVGLAQSMQQEQLNQMRELQAQLAKQRVQQGERQAEGQRLIQQAFDPQTVGVANPQLRGGARSLTPREAMADPRARSQIAKGLTMAGNPGAALSLGQAAEPKLRDIKVGNKFVTADLNQPDPSSPVGFKIVAEAPRDTGPDVVVMGGETEKAFDKERGKALGEQISGLIAQGRSAVGAEQTLMQLGDLMAEGVSTGSIQPAVTSLRALADDFGVSVDSVAETAGIDVANIGSQQEFDRLTRQLVIEGFEKFKGNLNQKEVDLAIGAFANLGRSEEANIKAIASGLAAQRIARERGAVAAKVTSEEGARALSQRIIEQDVNRFEQLRAQFEQQLREQRGMGSGGEEGFELLGVE